MIEIRAEPDRYRLFLDGTPMDQAHVIYDGAASRYKIRVLDSGLGDLLLALTPAEFPQLGSLRLQYEFPWAEKVDYLVLYIRLAPDPKPPANHVLQFGFQRGFSDWKTIYGFDDYLHGLQEFSRLEGETAPRFVKDARSDGQTEGFIAEFSFSSPHNTLGVEIDRCVGRLAQLHSVVRERESLAPRRERRLDVAFRFPPEVRTACQQYLLFFIEFLHDLGVEAASELKTESAGRVLFSIKPLQKQHALEQIRAALEAYLYLPRLEIEDVSLQQTTPEVRRLAETVVRLKQELIRAHESLETTNAKIETIQTVIDAQRKLLTGEVVYTSVEETKPPDGNEVILGGLVELTDYEVKGVILKWPQLYRRLRKLFTG